MVKAFAKVPECSNRFVDRRRIKFTTGKRTTSKAYCHAFRFYSIERVAVLPSNDDSNRVRTGVNRAQHRGHGATLARSVCDLGCYPVCFTTAPLSGRRGEVGLVPMPVT